LERNKKAEEMEYPVHASSYERKSTPIFNSDSTKSRRKNMSERTKDEILHDHSNDGIDRRGFLKCMAWAGSGMVWTIAASGIPVSRVFGQTAHHKTDKGDLHFLQISDSHIGFNKPANPLYCFRGRLQ
jgi:hypothetical protein